MKKIYITSVNKLIKLIHEKKYILKYKVLNMMLPHDLSILDYMIY